MGLFDAPETRSFLGQPWKKLSDEDKAKAEAAKERKKRVEAAVAVQEKLDEIRKLQAEIQVAKMNAVQASPGVFAIGLGSPGLNLGPEGLAGLAQRGGAELAGVQARLQSWLAGISGAEYQNMSQERQLLIQQYMQMEQYLRAVMRDNQLLQEELAYTQSVAQRHHHAFDDPYDDGADPAYDAQRRQRAAAHHPGHAPAHGHGHAYGHPPAHVHGHPHPHYHPHPHAHAHAHSHVHAHPPVATPCPGYTPAPMYAPPPCYDPHCQGACGTAHAPASAHCGHHHVNDQYAPGAAMSPGYARARAAQQEREHWFSPRQW